MSSGEFEEATASSDDRRRVVTCDLVFAVAEPGEVALQVVAADSAGRVLAERFDVAFEAMSRIDVLTQCFIAEVTTNYGTGLIQTIVHRDTKSTGSFFSAPRQADDIVTYEPVTNLAQLTARLAGLRTLVWNGPLGAFETEPVDAATVARALAK